MGLTNSATGVNYVRLKEHSLNDKLVDDGKKRYGFFLGKESTPYNQLEGRITKIFYKDEEYEGKPQRKLAVVLDDGSDSYQIALNVESAVYNDFIKFLANIPKPFETITLSPTIDVITKDGKEFTKRGLLIAQNGEYAKSYFTKEDPKGLPSWESVKVGTKVYTDKTKYLEFLEQFVNDKFINKLPKTFESPKVEVRETENDDIDISEDELPF